VVEEKGRRGWGGAAGEEEVAGLAERKGDADRRKGI
jgi:hypothetical protein